MSCSLCGTTMPESDWAKHKKGKKHRNKVEKSGADMGLLNAAIENCAVGEVETVEQIQMEVDIPEGVKIFFRANRVSQPISDGRTRYLSRESETDAICCHEYRNTNALWRFNGTHIICCDTSKFLIPSESRDAHSKILSLQYEKPEHPWIINLSDNGKLIISYDGMFLTPVPLTYIKGLAVSLVVHKYPNYEVSLWEVVHVPKILPTTIYRGRVKMHSKESSTGFISCEQTFEILSRDIYFERAITEDSPCLTHKIVDFTVRLDPVKGLPFVVSIKTCSKYDAHQYIREIEEHRRLKKYNLLSGSS